MSRLLLPSIYRWCLRISNRDVLDSSFRSHRRAYSDLPEELLPIVAIVGRPNVGKSAIFNRLIRSRQSIVHNTPTGHVTRDYQESSARLGDLTFLAVDTSGLEPFLPSGTIQARATALTTQVLHRSDVALFLVDGKEGVLPPDVALAQWLRESAQVGNKVILAANKCERRSKGGESDVSWALSEASRLGYGEPIAISAETGEGLVDLYDSLSQKLDPIIEQRRQAVLEIGGIDSDEYLEEEEGDEGQHKRHGDTMKPRIQQQQQESQKPMKVAIMGLINVGKSTLTNWLLQQDRCLTGPEPGLTRDAISTKLLYNDTTEIELIDTAGWVKKTRLPAHDDSGGLVAMRTLEEARTVLRFVHVVVLVLDALRVAEREEGMTHAEASLASNVVAEGRSLVVVLNKMDALPSEHQRQSAMEMVHEAVEGAAPGTNAVVLGVSAVTGQGAGSILPAALSCYTTWNTRVSTARLNRWLEGLADSLAGGGGGAEVRRIKYVSQIKARPPTFVAFVSGAATFPDAAQRFLANRIRNEFQLQGVPLRVIVRHQVRNKKKTKGHG